MERMEIIRVEEEGPRLGGRMRRRREEWW